nr:hypothetical protein CFP56_14922 [Quercus suber]
MMVDRECMAHAVDSPSTKVNTSKDVGEREDTLYEDKLEDNPKDMYGPWEANIGGVNVLSLREGKRKVVANYSPNEAQIAKAVQSIAKEERSLGQKSRKVHNEAKSPKDILSPSVRGKKGIARNRASSSLDKKLVVKPAGLESPTPVIASFLDNRGFNPNLSFNFKATCSGQSVGRGIEEWQMAEQKEMEVRNSPNEIRGNNDELACAKITSVVVEKLIEVECQEGSESYEQGLIENGTVRVGVTDRMGKGHSVADQMEFEEEGVGPPSL